MGGSGECFVLGSFAARYSSTSCEAFLRMDRLAFPLPLVCRSFMFFQIPQQMAMNSSSSPGRRCSHLRSPSNTSRNFHVVEISKGSASLLHFQTSLVCSQNHKVWPVVSMPPLHNSHTPSSVIFLLARFYFEVRMSRLTFQAKCLIF